MMVAVANGFAHRSRGIAGLLLALAMLVPWTSAQAQLPHIAYSRADLVVIYKGDRLLQLKRNGQVLRSFDIALGVDPRGHKRMEGDGRTPEGVYKLDWRNPRSQFHRSMHISYPQEDDEASAIRWGVSPGGLIMIHGLPNGRQASEVGHPRNDWTNGCIAVTNEQIDEIWSLVDDGTTVIIFP